MSRFLSYKSNYILTITNLDFSTRAAPKTYKPKPVNGTSSSITTKAASAAPAPTASASDGDADVKESDARAVAVAPPTMKKRQGSMRQVEDATEGNEPVVSRGTRELRRERYRLKYSPGISNDKSSEL